MSNIPNTICGVKMNKLILLILALFVLPSYAAERQFDIEMIVFKRAVDPEKTAEVWPNSLPAINFNNVGYFQSTEYAKNKGVTFLSPKDFQLNDSLEKLNKHAGFEVLLHKVWRQGDQGKAAAPKFRIRAGKDFSQSFNQDGSQKVSFTDMTDANGEALTEQTIDKPLYQLDGVIQVYVQHYLFFEAQLDLKAPGVRDVVLEDKQIELTESESNDTVQIGNLEEISPTIQVEEFLKSYRLDQKRRMRSSETHYIDHPLMGIIIQVRRVPSE